MRKTTHSLLLAVVASSMLLPVSALQGGAIRERGAIQMRALLAETSAAASSAAEPSSAAPTSTQAPTSTVESSSSAAAITTSSAAAPTSAPAASTSAAAVASTAPTSANANPSPVSTAHPVESSAVATTNAQGQVVTSVIEITPSSSSAAASQSSASNNSSSDDSGGLSTGSIIGLSISGGVALLGIILFFVWKFTRKRFTDFGDDEAIKWPELNSHNTDVHALPTHSTGRAGFGADDSDINLTRASSPVAYANSIAASSVPEVYGTGDPYAVPPLPHLNPSQPYRDEPGTYGQPAGYYDPYRGPVPNTFTDTISDGNAESIPMTRMRSPGPQMAYDMQGRASPAPQAAMGFDDRSRSPNPAALAADRGSPSPHPGYGYGPR